MAFDPNKHTLVPKHSKVSDSDKKKLFEKYRVEGKELPRIFLSDPSIQKLTPKVGDVIKIERQSETAGIAFYYRTVVE